MAVVKRVDLDKIPVNRKLIWWLFMGTGMLSLGIWLWGFKNKAGSVWEPKTISYEIQPPAIKKERDDTLKTQQLVAEIKEKLAGATGIYSLFVYRLEEGESYGINEEEIMPGASIMKVPTMITVFKAVENGEMTLDDIYTLIDADKRTGSGPLEYMTAGTRLPISRLLSEMGKKSDNTAWVALNKKMGVTAIAQVMTEMGMTKSDYRELNTTALDVGKMWLSLYRAQIVTPTSRDMIWDYLRDSIYEDRITKGLPEGMDLVHKVGTDVGLWSDSGIALGWKETEGVEIERAPVKPLIVVVMNKEVKRDEANILVPEIVRMVWEHEVNR